MSALADYQNKYQSARMERRDGILQVNLHTDRCAGDFCRMANCRSCFTTSAPTATTGSLS